MGPASSTWLAAVDGNPDLATQPVGTGPFMVDVLQAGRPPHGEEEPELLAAPGEGLPYLDSIEFRVIQDKSTRTRRSKRVTST